MEIRRATISDLKEITRLFNAYRIFYDQQSDLPGCEVFIRDRLNKEEAIIFLAENTKGVAVGFTLLYPTFSSVARQRVFVLNDLYVDQKFRSSGIGARLLESAAVYGKVNGAIRLHLETGHDNTKAQALYEKEGWVKEGDTFHYNYTL